MKLNNLEKRIGQQVILKDINLTITEGEITGIIGRNASGKTTLFRVLAGLYSLDNGSISIENQEISKNPLLKQKIFYIDEENSFLTLYSLKKIQEFFLNAYPYFDKDKYIQLTKENKLDEQSKYGTLSKGMKGLYRIILAICSNATYLLLDEPIDGLDTIVRKKIISLLVDTVAEKRCAVVISSHNLDELEMIIDRALFLNDQQIQQEYLLETVREHSRKVQLVFSTKQIPQVIKENSKLLHYQGRVITVIFENYTPKLEEKIKREKPLLYEELPLSLEDLFEINFSKPQ